MGKLKYFYRIYLNFVSQNINEILTNKIHICTYYNLNICLYRRRLVFSLPPTVNIKAGSILLTNIGAKRKFSNSRVRLPCPVKEILFAHYIKENIYVY